MCNKMARTALRLLYPLWLTVGCAPEGSSTHVHSRGQELRVMLHNGLELAQASLLCSHALPGPRGHPSCIH